MFLLLFIRPGDEASSIRQIIIYYTLALEAQSLSIYQKIFNIQCVVM